ncbi:MAG: IS1634 family transposase [Actinomycetia bacterium]|nr:IS1634 family transposase [Actinomycetes bacterium]
MQIVWSTRRGSRQIEHLGSARDEAELAALRAVAVERIAAGQTTLDFTLGAGATDGPTEGPRAGPTEGRRDEPAEIVGAKAARLWSALRHTYRALGLDAATDKDEVFRALVLARVIDPASTFDSLRTLAEAGVGVPSYQAVTRQLAGYGDPLWRERVSAACAAHAALEPDSMVLCEVSRLRVRAEAGDGFGESAPATQRRLAPQVIIGLLTDADGFPLQVLAFEDNRAEVATMVPTLRAFMETHGLADITVVADTGKLSPESKREIEASRLGFILEERLGAVPGAVEQWRERNPGRRIPDGLTLAQPAPAAPEDHQRAQIGYLQYRRDRARRTGRAIDQRVAKAERAIAAGAPARRNRFSTTIDGEPAVNRELEASARALAGWKSYRTNIADPDLEFVLGARGQLGRVAKAFGMSEHDLRARPIYHHRRESIEAHLSVALAAAAVTHEIEHRTGWPMRRLVRAARHYPTIAIRAGSQTLTAEEPLPDDLRRALALIS